MDDAEIIRRLADGENPWDIDPEYGCMNPLTGYFPAREVLEEKDRRAASETQLKLIDIKEFRERGYLHEVNRLVLHPIGLALSTTLAKENGRVLSLREPDWLEATDAIDEAITQLGAEGVPTTALVALTKLRAMLDQARTVNEGDESLGNVWDYRDDPEGMSYGADLLSADKATKVCAEVMLKRGERIKRLGYVIQPFPDKVVLTTNYTDPSAMR